MELNTTLSRSGNMGTLGGISSSKGFKEISDSSGDTGALRRAELLRILFFSGASSPFRLCEALRSFTVRRALPSAPEFRGSASRSVSSEPFSSSASDSSCKVSGPASVSSSEISSAGSITGVLFILLCSVESRSFLTSLLI